MTDTLLSSSTLLATANINNTKALLALAGRTNGRPMPLCYGYFLDSPNQPLSAPLYWSSGQPATTVNATAGGWSVNSGLLTLQTPLQSGGTIAYLSTPNLGTTITRVGARLSFNPGTAGSSTQCDPNGIACVAITDGLVNPSNEPSMSCHFYITPYNWTLSVWAGNTHGGTGSAQLAAGNFSYALGMTPYVFYEMEAWIIGDTITVRLPDGSIQGPYTDTRISTYSGNWAFLESYTTGSTNSYAQWSNFWCDTGMQQPPSPGVAPVANAVFSGPVTIPELLLTGPNTASYGNPIMNINGTSGEVAAVALGTMLGASFTSTVTSATTITLSASSSYVQFFTGSTAQTVTLPVASTMYLTGQPYWLVNNSTAAVTVQSSGANTVVIIAAGCSAEITCILITGTTAASWAAVYYGVLPTSGKVLNVSNSLTLAGTDGTTMTFPPSSATVAGLGTAQTFTSTRINPRINTTASSATPAINSDTTDIFTVTALAAAITSMTSGLTGTPVGGQELKIRITDNGTARAITWGTSFASSGVATLLANTVISKVHWIALVWDDVKAKWICLACDASGY